MFALNINCVACVNKLWQVILGKGYQPKLTIILAPGVQTQHKLSFWESFNETLCRTWMQADGGRLTQPAYTERI